MRRRGSIVTVVLVAAVLGAPIRAEAERAAGAPVTHEPVAEAPIETARQLWRWPLAGSRAVAVAYRAPASAYGAGHRGFDLVATPVATVIAPAEGTVAFRGAVVDRPLLTIAHAGGYVSTFEPVLSTLSPGDRVAAGDVIGTIAAGGHARIGTLHMGVRLDGVYIDPQAMFGPVSRAVLLPCCGPL